MGWRRKTWAPLCVGLLTIIAPLSPQPRALADPSGDADAQYKACLAAGEARYSTLGSGDFSYLQTCTAQRDARTGQSTSGTAGPDSPQCKEARIGINWVLNLDAGARGTFAGGLQSGLSPLDAVIWAQHHDPHAQEAIRECASSAQMVAELGGGGGGGSGGAGSGAGSSPNGSQLSTGTLSSQSCRCVSIMPAPGVWTYSVTNNCGVMDVWVHLKGTMLALADDGLPISQWGYAGRVGGGNPNGSISAPGGWTISSLAGFDLKDQGSEVVCPIP